MKNKKLGILATLISVFSNTTPAIAESMPKPENETAYKPVIQKEMKPQLTQRQLLEKTLYLMDNTRSIDELTPQRLEEIYGVKLNVANRMSMGSYGFWETLSESYGHTFEITKTDFSDKKVNQLIIDFGFEKTLPDKEKFALCEWTVDDFGFKSMDMGFKVEPILAIGNLPILEGMKLTKGNVIAEIRMEAAPELKTSYIESIYIRFIEPAGE